MGTLGKCGLITFPRAWYEIQAKSFLLWVFSSSATLGLWSVCVWVLRPGFDLWRTSSLGSVIQSKAKDTIIFVFAVFVPTMYEDEYIYFMYFYGGFLWLKSQRLTEFTKSRMTVPRAVLVVVDNACVRSFANGINGIPMPSEVLALEIIGYHCKTATYENSVIIVKFTGFPSFKKCLWSLLILQSYWFQQLLCQFILIMELLKTMTYFRCLPPTESYQWQLIFMSFQIVNGTNGNQWQPMVPMVKLPMVPLVKLRTHRIIVDGIYPQIRVRPRVSVSMYVCVSLYDPCVHVGCFTLQPT